MATPWDVAALWSDEQVETALAELRDDPASRGYAGMTDLEVANDMALRLWPAPLDRGEIDPWLLHDLIPAAEKRDWYVSADETARAFLQEWMAMLQARRFVAPNRPTIQTAFTYLRTLGVLSVATLQAMAALIRKETRWEALKLPEMTEGRVKLVRSWIV